MPKLGFAFQVFICLLGLFILAIDIILLRNKASRVWSLSILGVGLSLVFASFGIGYWRSYQCASIVPDQIKIVGHVRDDSNSYLNNYMVLLFKGNNEIRRAITAYGKFDGNRNDQPNDGYFELDVPNTEKLNRCSLAEDFRQDISRSILPWSGSQTTYLWRDFPDLRAGTLLAINKDEGEKKYTLVVLPASLDGYPADIKLNATYLNESGRIAINMPVKMYSMAGNIVNEKPTEYFIIDKPTANTLLGGSDPLAEDVRDAWVVEGSTNVTPGMPIADDVIIDIDNCGKPQPRNETIKASIIYIHEVQFLEENNSLSHDLGKIASKAAPSLGFTQGLVDKKEASESVEVPVDAHMKYLFYWQEQWTNGQIIANVDQNMVPLFFKARNDMSWYLTPLSVDCP